MLFKFCKFVNNKSICLSCWVDDEDKEKVGGLKLKINHFDIDEICIPERTLVRIEK